jgi:hypothetical protein
MSVPFVEKKAARDLKIHDPSFSSMDATAAEKVPATECVPQNVCHELRRFRLLWHPVRRHTIFDSPAQP